MGSTNNRERHVRNHGEIVQHLFIAFPRSGSFSKPPPLPRATPLLCCHQFSTQSNGPTTPPCPPAVPRQRRRVPPPPCRPPSLPRLCAAGAAPRHVAAPPVAVPQRPHLAVVLPRCPGRPCHTLQPVMVARRVRLKGSLR